MSLALTYRSSIHVNLRDDTYRWVDSARFMITGAAPNASSVEVLEVLLGHDQYVNHYELANKCPTSLPREEAAEASKTRLLSYLFGAAIPDPLPDLDAMWAEIPTNPILAMLTAPNSPPTGPPTHGPYLMERYSAATFTRLDPGCGQQPLIDWLHDEGHPQPGQIEGDLPAVLDQLAKAHSVYQLPDLGEEAQHETGWIVEPYFELVALDEALEHLWLIVAGGD